MRSRFHISERTMCCRSAAAGVTVFPIATHDTDYLLVRHDQLGAAIGALRAAGHEVGGEET